MWWVCVCVCGPTRTEVLVLLRCCLIASSVGSRRVKSLKPRSFDRLYNCENKHTSTHNKTHWKNNKIVLRRTDKQTDRYLTRAYCLNRVKLEEEFRKAISVGGSGGRSEGDGARIWPHPNNETMKQTKRTSVSLRNLGNKDSFRKLLRIMLSFFSSHLSQFEKENQFHEMECGGMRLLCILVGRQWMLL